MFFKLKFKFLYGFKQKNNKSIQFFNYFFAKYIYLEV